MNEDELKNENILKNCPPTLLLRITWIFLKTSHHDSHTTNDVKPEMLSGVQTGNRISHDEYNAHGIAHAHAYRKVLFFLCILRYKAILTGFANQ